MTAGLLFSIGLPTGYADLISEGCAHVQAASAAQWAGSYRPNQRLKARVLYVDPSDKRICLSLKPHLLSLQLPAGLPVQGTIVEVCLPVLTLP